MNTDPSTSVIAKSYDRFCGFFADLIFIIPFSYGMGYVIAWIVSMVHAPWVLGIIPVTYFGVLGGISPSSPGQGYNSLFVCRKSTDEPVSRVQGCLRGVVKGVLFWFLLIPLMPLFPGRRSMVDLICGTEVRHGKHPAVREWNWQAIMLAPGLPAFEEPMRRHRNPPPPPFPPSQSP